MKILFAAACLLWAGCQSKGASVQNVPLNQVKTDTLKRLEYLFIGGPYSTDDILRKKAALKLGFDYTTVGDAIYEGLIDSVKRNNAAVEKILEQCHGKQWKQLWEQEYQKLKQLEEKPQKTTRNSR